MKRMDTSSGFVVSHVWSDVRAAAAHQAHKELMMCILYTYMYID
jgi:hypothetical protein